jgi:hypothetical protein
VLHGFPAFQELFRSFGLKPDYKIKELELYERVTRLTLEILHYVDNPELPVEESEWPSWIPRWNQPTLYWSFPLQDYVIYSEKTHGLLSIVEGPQGDLLRLKRTQFWDATLVHWDPLVNVKEDKSVGLAQALTTGLDFECNSAAKSSARHTADAVDFLLQTVTTASASNQVLVSALYIRRLFRTTRGLFGLGPLAAQPGHIGVVPHGGYTPFVLRPRGKYHQLLGECYLHSMMGEDALDLCKCCTGEDMSEETIFEMR